MNHISGKAFMLLTLLLGTVSLANLVVAGGQNRATRAETRDGTTRKRFGIGVPSHLPLKIKVTNLESKKWVHDLEIEVTNISKKPIYFLDFYLTLPGIKGPLGNTVGFWLSYGRGELIDFSAPIKSDDVPIPPGETYVFKIPEGSANGWDYLREKEGKPEPTNLKLVFQELNFGDGTGYSDTNGRAVDVHKTAG